MSAETQRRVLFLQGPPSRFWPRLAAAFEASGHATFQISLCPADRLFWNRRGGVSFRGRFAQWPGFLTQYLADNRITDVLYYGDQSPYHREARLVAAAHGATPIAIEFGYLRPDWLTLERGGMGVYSHFPQEPAQIRAIAAASPAPDMTVLYPYSFAAEAFGEVTFNLLNVALWPLYRFYRSDKYTHPVLDYLCWVPRLLRQFREARRAAALEATLTAGADAFWLVALQLQSDYQIRRNSQYTHLSVMIEETVRSFAEHAPAHGRLVFKLHPLDNGMENWPKVVAAAAARHGCGDRVDFMDGGNLARLLEAAAGCIVVNSTVGLHAIRAGCPTKVLGVAVFDIAGLTHQGSLDDFWTNPERVDRDLAADFVRALAGSIQIRGSFYHPTGQARAHREIVSRVAGRTVNAAGGYVEEPPRLARARRLGVPLDARDTP